MSEFPHLAADQIEVLEPMPPNYEYEGLALSCDLDVILMCGDHESQANTSAGEIQRHRKTLLDSDIVVFEFADWTEAVLDNFLDISKGNANILTEWTQEARDYPNDQVRQNTAISSRVLFNVHKPLVVIDPPEGHPINQKWYEFAAMPVNVQSLDFREAVQETRSIMQGLAESIMERENFMLISFTEQVNELAVRHPKLSKIVASGEKLRVCLWGFGISHAGLLDGIGELARRSGREFTGTLEITNPDTTVGEHNVQYIGRYMRGLEIEDTLLAKLVVSAFMQSKSEHPEGSVSRKLSDLEVYLRVEHMSIEELETMYEMLKNNTL